MRRLTLVCSGATKTQRSARFPTPDEHAECPANFSAARLPTQSGTKIYCAPEQRAVDTARFLGLEAVSEPNLRDCDFGDWKGRSLADIEQQDSNGTISWLSDPQAAPHGGESIHHLQNRVSEWLNNHPDQGYALAITHAAVMRAALLYVLQAPFPAFWRVDVEPFTVMDFRSNGSRWSVRSINNLFE